MKNKELFDRTVAVLVKAYQNDLLEYSQPCGCAVGNICAAANGYTVDNSNGYFIWVNNNNERSYQDWPGVFINGIYVRPINKFDIDRRKSGIKEIEKTGYTPEQLRLVEISFREGWISGHNHEEKQFNGLLTVYDVLCEIHEVDKEEVEKGELVFVR